MYCVTLAAHVAIGALGASVWPHLECRDEVDPDFR